MSGREKLKIHAVRMAFVVSLVVGFLIFPGDSRLTGTSIASAEASIQDQVIVYQFHRRFRCTSCHELEELIRDTLEANYPEDLKSGKIVFRVIDLDAEGSEHFPEDYDFFYNTIIVVDVKGGKDTRFKNLYKLWEIYEDKEAASDFLRSEINEYMNGE
jgi:hypothetical protein